MGLNGEASIMLEGDIKHPEFEKIRNHIEHAKTEAVAYESGMKEAYSRWTNQFFNGLVQKSNDTPRDTENTKTILLFCEQEKGYPTSGDILYFELPQALGRVRSLRAEVHVFVFDNLPGNPFACLSNLDRATESFWCSVEGVENDTGGKELSADWYIDGQFNPILKKASNPFRPTPKQGMQQIRVRLKNQVYGAFDYHFGVKANEWFPILIQDKKVTYSKEYSIEIEKLKLIPPETVEWSLVKGLTDSDNTNTVAEATPYHKALKSLEPESGAFILFSTARRKIK